MAQERDNAIEQLRAADTDDQDRQIDVMREKIEETRENMGETIDAIQDRLSLSNISEQVTEQVSHAVETVKRNAYDATIGKAANMMNNIGNTQVGRTVRENPIPFLLIGTGAALLAYRAYSADGGRKTSPRKIRPAIDNIKNSGDESLSQSMHADGQGNERTSGIGHTLSSAASNVYHRAGDTVESAMTNVRDAAAQARDKAGELGSAARDQYDHYIEANPLAVGAVAFAVGAAVGLALPATETEGRLMGPARRKLLAAAETKASDVIDKTQQLVTEAGRAVGEQARAAISE